MTDSDENTRSGLPWWLIGLVSICVLVACAALAMYFLTFGYNVSTRQEIWAQFGDYVGGILNPIFAFVALIALLYTIVIQSRELRHSAEQLQKSADALRNQNKVLELQNFEATFFQLLRLYNDIVAELQIHLDITLSLKFFEEEDKIYENRECVRVLYLILNEEYLSILQRGDNVEGTQAAIDLLYQKFHSKYGHLIGHYFRTLYNVIKFIDKSNIENEQKYTYTKLLRAQLSKYELALLLYNCLSVTGKEKMRPLVKKYDILKHIEDEVLSRDYDKELMNRA